MGKVLMKGNEAIGEAAIRAGCLNYFAYPITPRLLNISLGVCRKPAVCFYRVKARLPSPI